jgi:hypothetical protein
MQRFSTRSMRSSASGGQTCSATRSQALSQRIHAIIQSRDDRINVYSFEIIAVDFPLESGHADWVGSPSQPGRSGTPPCSQDPLNNL